MKQAAFPLPECGGCTRPRIPDWVLCSSCRKCRKVADSWRFGPLAVNYTAAAEPEAGKRDIKICTVSFSFFKRILARKRANGLYNPHKETYGRRYANYVQRLWAGIYLQRCRSSVFSGTRLLDPEALQDLAARQRRTIRGDSGYRSAPSQGTPVICSGCGQPTTVPFEPRGDRPVFCRACYTARKGTGGGSRSPEA